MEVSHQNCLIILLLETAQKSLGIEAYGAMLSYSSSCSTLRKDNEKVREATRTVQAIAPDIPIEGPIQYDSAIDKGVLKHKIPSSKVAKKLLYLYFQT